jgi:predicted DNA-binding protein with PD1-like motif
MGDFPRTGTSANTAPFAGPIPQDPPAMRSRQIHEANGQRTYVVVLDTGDEMQDCLGRFAAAEHLSAAQVTAIGAFQRATLKFFDWETKDYLSQAVEEQTEVVSLIGDIAQDDDGAPRLHLHAVLTGPDMAARGGHLGEATVRPTLEVIVTESPAHLRRRHDPAVNLALIRFD